MQVFLSSAVAERVSPDLPPLHEVGLSAMVQALGDLKAPWATSSEAEGSKLIDAFNGV